MLASDAPKIAIRLGAADTALQWARDEWGAEAKAVPPALRLLRVRRRAAALSFLGKLFEAQSVRRALCAARLRARAA